jgi:hypothetical protein
MSNMAPQPLTVIAKIKPREEGSLRQILEAIHKDLEDNAYIHFPESRKTHFARLVILPDRGFGARLLFSSNYDGDLDSYLDELVKISPDLDEIWGKCEGYSGKQSFSSFVHQYSYQPQAFYVAFRDETVESLNNYIAIRQQIEQFLDLKDTAKFLDYPGLKPFLDRVEQVRSNPSWWKDLGLIGQKISSGLGVLVDAMGEQIRQFILSLLNFLGRILGRPSQNSPIDQYTSVKADLKKSQQLANEEGLFVQSPMTHLAEIKPGRLLRLQIVLFLINCAGKTLFPPGSLANITTIHFARWLIIDGGKRLLFLSNYDGSWENYLGDFVDRASDGLNSIWNNTVGYPEAGAQDIEAFKQYFREYQTPTQVYYSAYPSETVANSLRDRQISKTLSANFDRGATEQWLKLL